MIDEIAPIEKVRVKKRTAGWFDGEVVGSLNRCEIAEMTSIDLQKAFDTIDHKILLDKLVCLGFSHSALSWFKSYLLKKVM